MRPSGPGLLQCFQSRVRGKRATLPLALRASAGGRTARVQRGCAGRAREGPCALAPLFPPPQVAAAVRVAAAQVGFWLPPDTARPRIHKPARTRSRRAVFPGPGPRLWEGPGSRDPVTRGGGSGNLGVPVPVFRLCAPSPAPLGARRWHPALLPLGPRGSRGLPGAQPEGCGGGWEPRAPGREAVQLCAGESLDVGNSLPARPAERRGRAGAGRGQPRYPCGGRLALPRPAPPSPAGCSSGPGGSLPAGQPSLGGDPAVPPAAPCTLTSGSGLGLPPVLPPRGAACGGNPGAGGRAGESGARRPPGGAGGRAGARGEAAAACARVCEGESEGVSERERGRVRV